MARNYKTIFTVKKKMKGDALPYRVIKKWCLQIELSVEIICYKQNQKWESVKCTLRMGSNCTALLVQHINLSTVKKEQRGRGRKQ